MLIITEKPSVAKDFAKALECSFSASDKTYKSRDGKITIVHCVGHLFNLQQPDFYDEALVYFKLYLECDGSSIDIPKNEAILAKQAAPQSDE